MRAMVVVLFSLVFTIQAEADVSAQVVKTQYTVVIQASPLDFDALSKTSGPNGLTISFHRPFVKRVRVGFGYREANIGLLGDSSVARGFCSLAGGSYVSSTFGAETVDEFTDWAVRLTALGEFAGAFESRGDQRFIESVICRY